VTPISEIDITPREQQEQHNGPNLSFTTN